MLLAALILAFAVGVMVAAGSVATGEAGTPEPTKVITVGAGDTLWAIASDLADDGDVRSMMQQDREPQRDGDRHDRRRPAPGGPRQLATTQTSSAASTPADEPGKNRGGAREAPPLRLFRPSGGMAGYSGTPLAKKIGIKDEHVVFLDGAPDDLELDTGAARSCAGSRRTVDVTLTFHTSYAALESRLPTLFDRTVDRRHGLQRTSTAGMVWVCWPKKAAQKAFGIVSDIDDGKVRALVSSSVRRRQGRGRSTTPGPD